MGFSLCVQFFVQCACEALDLSLTVGPGLGQRRMTGRILRIPGVIDAWQSTQADCIVARFSCPGHYAKSGKCDRVDGGQRDSLVLIRDKVPSKYGRCLVLAISSMPLYNMSHVPPPVASIPEPATVSRRRPLHHYVVSSRPYLIFCAA